MQENQKSPEKNEAPIPGANEAKKPEGKQVTMTFAEALKKATGIKLTPHLHFSKNEEDQE